MGYAAPFGSPFPVSASTNLITSSSSTWKIENGPRERYLTNPTQKNMQVINLSRTTEMKSLDLRIEQTLAIANCRGSQSFYPWHTHYMMRSSRNRGAEIAIGIHPTSGIDSSKGLPIRLEVRRWFWAGRLRFELVKDDNSEASAIHEPSTSASSSPNRDPLLRTTWDVAPTAKPTFYFWWPGRDCVRF
ncbi:hypothetical protein CRG98_027382 [Punica granatum]|uniref:Uncharacterized protein n=1 Tax=Punica granatum TaxID=22663 RepID=A0A2I0J7I8_PUNGR|nr:hypothetical protein CRG98_027382 [Punica granatum]